MEKETAILLQKRYGQMLNVLMELKIGMSSRGNDKLDIPKCPVCPTPKVAEYCQTECEWAKIFCVCKKMGGKPFPEYTQIVEGINQAIDGFNFILSKISA